MRKLTNSGKAGQAALSPDGKLFAFSLRDAGRSSLWLGYVDGGEPIEIRQPAEMNYLNVRFSPDGSSLYYVASETFAPRGELYRLPVLGGAPERLVTNIRGAVTFASDGKRMAFVRIDPESQNQVLVVTDLRASNEKTITSPPAGSAFVANTAGWCPQSDLIAIGVSAQDPAPSGKIYMVDVSNGSMNALKTDEWSSVGGVTWLHDGSGLIVVATQKDVLAPQLWRVPYPEGESSRVVTDLSFYGSTLSLSADDQNLLAVQVQQESNIWSAPSSDLGKAQQITFGSPGQNNGWLGLQWLRDGRLIYTKQENSSISIWSTSTDGTAPRQLVPSGGINTLPSVPDSERYIVFQSNRSGTQSVWRSDLDGSNLRQLTTAGVAGEPRVSPDGKWVVYIADRDGSGDLLRIPIDGGESRKLSDKQFSWVSVSPDSRQIAGGCDDGGRQKLCIISIDGGPVQRTFDIPRLANFRLGVRWTPDGHGITYRDWGYGIWRQNVDGGEPVLLKDLPQEKFYGYGWSPDGKRFAYARGAEVDDVVWMSGLAH
jgi:Tol biopolymer transport system component